MLENWLKISILLCIFGFLREMRPSEPFAVEYFIQHRNVSFDELTNYYYPFGTYAYLSQLVIIFLITDIFRYKPIIILSAMVGMLLFGLLVWTTEKYVIEIIQVLYGTFMACEIAYYTYIYAKVERHKYQLVTGHTRSAILAGRFLGAVFAQLLVSFSLMNYRELLYISFGSQCISLIFALLLPAVSISLYFFSNVDENKIDLPKLDDDIDADLKSTTNNTGCDSNTMEKSCYQTQQNERQMPIFSIKHAITRIGVHITTSYSNTVVIQWSILWAISMCGFLQVQSYIQPLWKEIDPTETNLYNGAVEALITLLGAITAFVAGYLESKSFRRYEIWILTFLTLIEGFLLIWAALTMNLWCCYVSYIIFGMIYHFVITIASASVAKKLHEDCFALIFGINTLIALILQSLLTFIAISKLQLSHRTQYQLYAYLFFGLTLIYGVIGIQNEIHRRRRKTCSYNTSRNRFERRPLVY